MKITTLSQFQKEFKIAFENSINQKFVIDNEINEILNYINNVPDFRLFKKPLKYAYKNNSNKIFIVDIPDSLRILFSKAFNKYMLEGKFILERFHSDTDEVYQIKEDTVKQANEFSEYYKWLNELLIAPQKAQKKNSLPIKQKLLALHYLGLDTRGNDNNKIAEILATVLDVGSENIRKSLSHLYAGKNNEVRTKNNLTEISQLFENQGLIEISNKIKSDIEKL